MVRKYLLLFIFTGIVFALSVVSGRRLVYHLPLRIHAERHNLLIGVSVGGANLSDAQYAQTLAREFSILTPENAMKFGVISLSRGEYDFSEADAIVEFAESHDMMVRGHTLVWTNQLPTWLVDRQWTRDELISILHDHIFTLVGRYRGRIYAWDVVNEAIANDGSIAVDNFWYQGIGPEYIAMSYQWAHEADPNALLFYNDVFAEGLGEKSDGVYSLISSLLMDRIPIHGVGLEMHTGIGWSPSPIEIAMNMFRLGELGLQVHITEMDVRMPAPSTLESLEQQATIYQEILDTCLTAPNCTAFVMWGLTDAHSWIPYFYPEWGAALIIDEFYHPKPAYIAIEELLSTK